jgi:hypothetical protein
MTVEVDIAKMQEQIEALERWQTAQNGTLLRLSQKLDDIDGKMDSRFDSMKTWIIGALTSSTLALVVLALNLAIGKP